MKPSVFVHDANMTARQNAFNGATTVTIGRGNTLAVLGSVGAVGDREEDLQEPTTGDLRSIILNLAQSRPTFVRRSTSPIGHWRDESWQNGELFIACLQPWISGWGVLRLFGFVTQLAGCLEEFVRMHLQGALF
jgi:hypothetical protein